MATTRKRPAGAAPAKAARAGAAHPSESSLYVNSVDKAFRILSVFQVSRRRLSLSQIATLAELDLSSAQRFTFTLQHLDLLRKDAVTKLYELSPRMLDFAHRYIASNDFVNRATPYAQQLALETEETVNVTTLDGTEVVFLQRFVSRHVLTPEVIVGSRLPAYCTSSGLAMLSALPDEQAREILQASTLERHTQYTVTSLPEIMKRLKAIREVGYAHTENEMFLGDIATAVPIVGPDGQLAGAINVAVAGQRWKGGEDEARFSSLLLSTGRAISGRL